MLEESRRKFAAPKTNSHMFNFNLAGPASGRPKLHSTATRSKFSISRSEKWISVFSLIAVLLLGGNASAQLTLGTSPYTQNFDALSAFPTGWTVRTGATASSLGTSSALTTAASSWVTSSTATNAAVNYAAAEGSLTSASNTATQAAATDRALGVKPTGTVYDAAGTLPSFVLQLANTTGLTGFSLSYKMMSCDAASLRTSTWVVDYGFGSSPASFLAATTAPATVTTSGTWGSTTVSVNFGSALDNQSGNVWIRIRASGITTGSGTRPTSAIDDVSLTYSASTPSIVSSPTSLTYSAITVGTQSASQTIALTGSNLTGAPGNIAVAASSTDYQVSLDNSSWASSVNVAYSSATLSSSTVYVRFTPQTATGTVTGSLSITGGGIASAVTVSLSGTSNPLINPTLTTSGTFPLAFGSVVATGTSTSQSFNLSGTDLQSSPGNITITAPSTNYQVSSDNSTWGPTALIPYTTSTLGSTPVYVRFTPQAGGSFNQNVTMSGGSVVTTPTVAVTGTGLSPVITIGTALTKLFTDNGTPSNALSYTVSGSSLGADITINAPTGFEIKKSTDLTYSSSLVLTQTAGTVTTTTINVRLTGAISGYFAGNITHVSVGATTQNRAANGIVSGYLSDFSQNNVIVVQVGNGSAALSAAAARTYLVEYSSSTGLPIQAILMPLSDSGANQTFTSSGSATTEGHLTLSPDGYYLALAGYDAAEGTASVNGTTAAAVNRVIARVTNTTAINTTTTISDGFSTGSIRSAVANGSGSFYTAGSTGGGIRYSVFGSSTSTLVAAGNTNQRGIAIFNGQLYSSTGASPAGIGSVGSGLPISTGNTISNITTTGVDGFIALDLDGSVAGADVIYAAQSGVLAKYYYNGTSWTAAGSVSISTIYSVTGRVVSGQAEIWYSTTGGIIGKLTDAAAYNATISGTATPMFNSPTVNQLTRGISFGPACAPITWYQDLDGDTYGNSAVTQSSCTQPVGYVANSTDCNDSNASINPGASEGTVCDNLDNDCNGQIDDNATLDPDNDGYSVCEGDCDNTNNTVYPGALEICDGLDNNCNTAIDETPPSWYLDGDADGYGAGTATASCTSPGPNYVSNNTDCNDSNAAINPATVWYQDADNDNYTSGTTLTQCTQPVGYKLLTSLTSAVVDCNDANATINPATVWYQDFDGDTYGNLAVTLVQCAQPVGYVSNSTDCNDQFATVKPGATETACDGFDNNCNGNIDENSVTGCTDPLANNYNVIANCDNGTCIYAWSFTAGNLVVSRVGTGAAALTSASTAIYLDQYDPTTAAQASPVHSFPVPRGGTNVLTTSGSSTAEGQLSRATDGQSISLAGYGAYAGVTAIASTTSAQYARVAGSLAINYQWSRPISTSSVYSGVSARGAARNGSNYWSTGAGEGVYYMGTGTPSQLTFTGTGATLPANNRSIQVFNNNLYFSTGSGTTARGVWKVGSSLPTSGPLADSSVPQLIATGSTSSPYAFQFNADETVCYIADDRTTNGGIMKYSYNGTAWTFVRTMSVGTGLGASGIYVDFYSGPNPIIYAIAKDAAATVSTLVRFIDTNTNTPTLTTLATAATNQAFRAVVLAPCNDVVWYRDADGDGYGDIATTLSFCTQPYGYVANSTDCDDTNAEINPATVWHSDFDGDGYANSSTLTQCARPSNYYLTSELTATSGDCNDSNSAINPAATEICNGVDDDCNTQIDENILTLTTSTSGIGTISPAGPVSLSCGGSQTFTFSPDPCYEVSDVLIDGISVGSPSSYTFSSTTGDHTVHVAYTIKSLPITVNTVGFGTVNAQAAVICGNNTNIFLAAGDCYRIASVFLDGVEVTEAANTGLYQLSLTNVTSAPVVDVTFVIQTYTASANVSSSDGSGASITPSGASTTYNCGDAVTYNFSPNSCSQIVNVLLNGISQGAVSSLTLPDVRTNYSIVVLTSNIDYTITATANTGGTISNGGTVTYTCGDTPSYTINSQLGYAITGVLVDGLPVGAVTSYSFTALGSNHTIAVTFTPETINNSWANAQQVIAPTFPSCANTSGSLAGCNASSQASYVTYPIGAGQDAWYRFQMPANSSGTARIIATSSVNNLAIILQRETSTSTFYTQVAVENALSTVGGEQMTVSGLVPGAFYRVGIKNMDVQSGGSFSLCISPLKANTCGTATSPTSGKSLCDAFLGTYTGAQQYVFTFTNTANSSEVFTHTNTGVGSAAASSAVVLSSISGLTYGQSYYVKIDASYTFANSTGATQTVVVPGTVNGCALYISAQPNTELSITDWCGNGAPKRFNSFVSTTWVCGAVDYQWEITPTTGLPIAQTTFRGAATRYILVNSLNGIHGGATTFNVRVRPIFSDGLGGTRFGSWSATSRQLCILAPAGLDENNQNVTERSLSINPILETGIYPNPNRGDLVNVNMMNIQSDQVTVKVIDAMGQLIINKTFSVDGILNTVLHFEKTLASGVYMIEMIDGSSVSTSRMIVQK
jgi:hypothetical protein